MELKRKGGNRCPRSSHFERSGGRWVLVATPGDKVVLLVSQKPPGKEGPAYCPWACLRAWLPPQLSFRHLSNRHLNTLSPKVL